MVQPVSVLAVRLLRRRARWHAPRAVLVPVVTALALAVAFTPAQRTSLAAASAAFDEAGLDGSVAPGDDFFAFANGTWLARTEIPPDRSTWGVFDVLAEEAMRRTRGPARGRRPIARAAALGASARWATSTPATSTRRRSRRAACGRSGRCSTASPRSTAPRALARVLGEDLRADVDPLNNTNFHTDRLFGLWVVARPQRRRSRTRPTCCRAVSTCPIASTTSATRRKWRRSARSTRRTSPRCCGWPGSRIRRARPQRIVALEGRMARVHATRLESLEVRDGEQPVEAERVREPRARSRLERVLRGRAARDAAGHHRLAPARDHGAVGAGRRASRSTRGRTGSRSTRSIGTPRVLPRAFVERALRVPRPDPQRHARDLGALEAGRGRDQRGARRGGRAAVRRALFPAGDEGPGAGDGREHRGGVRPPHRARCDWMSPATKAKAREKLATLQVGVGYPDTWIDYSALEVVRGDAFGNSQRASLFEYRRSLAQAARSRLTRPSGR